MSTQHLIILAGGRGTRLSPLTGSTSKALVSVGQRPVIIQQIIGLGVQNVTVVVSPTTLGPVRDVLTRGLPRSYRVDYAVQERADGPENAIHLGTAHLPLTDSVMILFADTLLDWETVPHDGTWIGTGRGTWDRSWCYSVGQRWIDGVPNDSSPVVFVGALRVEKLTHLRAGLWSDDTENDGMARLLSTFMEYHPAFEPLPGWVDTGDLKALANARRVAFRTRETNDIELTNYGTIIKRGTTIAQSEAMVESPLYPHVYDAHQGVVEMDYVSAPSLAELYLYGSPNVTAWRYMLETVIDRCEDYLWVPAQDERNDAQSRCAAMYLTKMRERAHGFIPSTDVELLAERLASIIDRGDTPHRQVRVHGDLNFCNILYDVGSDVIKLIDPRGEWGDSTGYGDILYEAAKLRYSWRAFAAINHDVFGRHNDSDLVRALDEVLYAQVLDAHDLTLEDCAAVEASLFWSALPLHPPRHHEALITMGYECLKEASAKI